MLKFLKEQGFIKPVINRSSVIRNDNSIGNNLDKLSRDIFLTRWSNDDGIRALQEFGEVLGCHYPIKLTSYYRNSPTHLFGAIDLAPDTDSKRYGHNIKLDPRLYARKNFIKNIIRAINTIPNGSLELQAVVEDNHVHVHPLTKVKKSGIKIPRDVIILQKNDRAGYNRTGKDRIDDDIIFGENNHRSIHDVKDLNKLPEFQRRI